MNTTLNKYEIITQLKQFLKNIEQCQDSNLDVLLHQVKAFIFSNDILKNEYELKNKQF